MAKFKKYRFFIATSKEGHGEYVDGYISGQFGHYKQSDKCYVVTHIETGMLVKVSNLQREARAFIGLANTLDWSNWNDRPKEYKMEIFQKMLKLLTDNPIV